VSARAWSAFATLSLLWGASYMFIKIAVDDGVPPAFVAWLRVALAAVVLLALAARAGVLASLRGRLRPVAAYALGQIAIPFPLLASGERHVSSSLTAILVGTVPLLVALLALRFDSDERASGRRLLGLLLGLAGVAALVGIDVAGTWLELFGAGQILIASLGFALGSMIVKRHLAGVDPRAAMGASLGLATLLLTPLAAVDLPVEVPSASAWSAMATLGLLSTAAGLVALAMLIAEVGAGRAMVVTYVNPLVAVVLGMVVLSERPGLGAIAGLALIVLGSWLATGAAARRRVPLVPSAATGR
jgi:drug/metabolite transporter (DMT)-like permease